MGQGLDWLANEMDWARRMSESLVSKTFPRHRHLIDDMTSECVDRADQVANTYDELKGASLSTHMKVNLRWYVFKRLRKMQRLPRPTSIPVDLPERTPDTFQCQRVIVVMEKLNELDRVIIVLRHVNDMSFQQIANELGVSRNTARTYYHEAMRAARALSS